MPSSPTTTPIDLEQLTAVAAELGGSDWLVAQRRAAAAQFVAADLPTDELEEWRYSRVDDLDLGSYPVWTPGHDGPSGDGPAVPDLAPLTVNLLDGALESLHGLDGVAGLHVSVIDSAELDPGLHDDGLDAFDHLNAAIVPSPILISVDPGVTVAEPLQVNSVLAAAGVLTATRVVIDLGEDSELTVLDWSTSDGADRLTLPRVVMRLGPASRLRWMGAQDVGRSTVSLGRQVAEVGRDATLSVTYTALGGASARMRFDTGLVGRGGSTRLNAVYFGNGTQHHDLRTFPSHVAPDTTSRLDFRGALDDASTAVYTGLVAVGPEARGTNAEQSNRIIKLSEEAWAESVPNLEIHNNDVRCAHASAVGPIDADQRFYLESRGIVPETAEQLVVSGFFADLLVDTTIGPFADVVTDRLARRWETSS